MLSLNLTRRVNLLSYDVPENTENLYTLVLIPQQ